ncbi:hypothetical protein N7520_007021 [Penicillium odoratum]|uniref:uncharacterized protein n=1 Tax=Penicillium odoratum TaxID=1167516 RepID=UPI002547AAB7|nr:uncharacterized protein N7520_007021 [Penicillium odoratum]KAJ5759865.1 hypothetical protein N7520_007021 [Penicillium odoratum]
MAETNPTKRARANSADDSNVTKALDLKQVQLMVESDLDQKAIIKILTKAMHAHPDIAKMVVDEVCAINEAARNRVLSFDHYSTIVWHLINNTRGISGSKQYDMSFEVVTRITSIIESIAAQCGPVTNPKTRYNGLSVLRKIGKSICLSTNSELARQVRMNFQWDTSFKNAMWQIDVGNSEALWPKLKELLDISQDEMVLDLIEGKHPSDYDDDESKSEDEESE